MKRIPKQSRFALVKHAIFGDGLLIGRRFGDSGRDLADCMFLSGSAPRTILSECLILFRETRHASLQERRGIARWLSKQPTKPIPEPEPDDRPDSRQIRRTDEDLALATLEELTA